MKVGAEVLPGERIVDLTAGEVVVQISSPIAGLVAQRAVAKNVAVRPGDLLALITAT